MELDDGFTSPKRRRFFDWILAIEVYVLHAKSVGLSEGEYVSEELVRSVDDKRHQHITAGARTTAGFSVSCVCCIAAP